MILSVIQSVCVKYVVNPIYNIYFRNRVKNVSFSIISNNCWGGGVYQDLKLPYTSPTIGLFFYVDDYLEFLRDLKYYLSCNLLFVEESKYEDVNVERMKSGKFYPIGLLDNKVEIHFLHYKTEEEAMTKWHKRARRVDFDNLFIKMDDRDGCTEKSIYVFDKLPYKNKIFFSSRKMDCISVVWLKLYSKMNCVGDLYANKWSYRRCFDIISWLNGE